MKNRMKQVRLHVATILGVLFLAAGCGKGDDVVVDTPLTREQALEVSKRIGDSYRGTSPLDFTLGLFGFAGSGLSRRAETGPALLSTRPARRGVLTGDDETFVYEIQAFDAANNPVPWDTVDWDLVARVNVNWNWKFDFADSQGANSWKGHSRGTYDVSGLLAESPEVLFAGAAQDTFAYRWAYLNYRWSGDGTWLASIQGLRVSKDLEHHPYPLAGREAYDVDQRWTYSDGSGSDSEQVKANVVIEFDGTRFATITVGNTHRFRLDLDTGEIIDPAA